MSGGVYDNDLDTFTRRYEICYDIVAMDVMGTTSIIENYEKVV